MFNMNHEEHSEKCAVCKLKLGDPTKIITREEDGMIFDFCSEKCLNFYLEDPMFFIESEDETDMYE